MTPTIPMSTSLPEQGILRNQTSNQFPSSLIPGLQDNIDRNVNLPNGILGNTDHIINITEHSPGSGPNRLSRLENSVSASTVETTLTTSPSDPLPLIDPLNTKSNCNVQFARSNPTLQPHQGQNPTVERNTHKRSDDKLVVLGNTLVDRSIVDEAQSHSDRSRVLVNTNSSFTDDLLEAIADNLESSLVQNDLLSQQQRYAGPSVVQNQVHPNHSTSNPSEPLIARPKQPNVPGNGTHPHHYTQLPPHPEQPQKQKSKFRFKRPKEKLSGKMSELYLLGRNLFKSSHHGNNSDDSANYYPTENLRNPTPGAQVVPVKPPGSHHRSRSDGGSNLSKSNLEPRQVPTEVCLMNGSAIVRPTSLPLNGNETSLGYNIDQPSTTDSTQEKQLCEPSRRSPQQRAPPGEPDQLPTENRLGFAEVGVAKLESGCAVPGQPAMMRVKLKSQSSVDLSPTNSALIDFDDDSKPRRPNSLSINGHSYKKAPLSVPCLNNSGRTEPTLNMTEPRRTGSKTQNEKLRESSGLDHLVTKRRLNSPLSLKNGRFSLYDDRVMSQSASDVNSGKQKRDKMLGKSSISLTQFGSVDTDLNKFHAADYPC